MDVYDHLPTTKGHLSKPRSMYGIYADQARGGARGANGAAVRTGSPMERLVPWSVAEPL